MVLRRAWEQRRLLSAVVLLVAAAAALAGFYSLLLGVTGPRAFTQQLLRTSPDEVGTTAYAVDVSSGELDATDRAARTVLAQVLAPLHPTSISTATSQMRQLGDSGRLGYLATIDRPREQVALTSGRWPRPSTGGPLQALAPESAARALRLRLGQRIELGPGTGLGESERRATIVLVGTFGGLPRAVAASDPLSGAGTEAAYKTGGLTAPAYGPFLVEHDAFRASRFEIAGLRVDAEPQLRGADEASLRTAVGSLGGASALLADRVGDRAQITRVGSELPDTSARLQAQAATTRSAILVALLLDVVLAASALVLAGRLVTESRRIERRLLTSWGLAPSQHLRAALLEAVLLAGTAALLAVPVAAATYGAVTHLPGLAAAGLSESGRITWPLVLTAMAVAALLMLVLVLSPLLTWEPDGLSRRRQLALRSGVNVLLLVAAGLGWWQLHTRVPTTGRPDIVLALAPVLVLTALCVVVSRILPVLFERSAEAGLRARGLLPVALDPGQVRVRTGAALVLLALASASATFGVSLHATWHRSQVDQADLAVGTDLALTLEAPSSAQQARSVADIVGREPRAAVSPVVTGPVALGHYLGDSGEPPLLVALDTGSAGHLLRGRQPRGRTWGDVGGSLAPTSAVAAVPLGDRGGGITAQGFAPSGVMLSVTPTLVVQDSLGFRSTLAGLPMPLDGQPHPLRWSAPPPPGQRIVAVHLAFADAGSATRAARVPSPVSVRLRVHGAHPPAAGRWEAHTLGRADGTISSPSVSVRGSAGSTLMTIDAQVRPEYLQYEEGDLVSTAFPAPTEIPVAVSQNLVDALGTRVGGSLSATVGDTSVTMRVTQIVPEVPSAPGRIAVLADQDALSRALIAAGHLESPVDAFWVSRPSARTTVALRDLGIGEVSTRHDAAAERTRGPMPITLPLAYATVAGSSVVLLMAGAVLVVSADRRSRTTEVARLRALGLHRAGARRLVMAQHGTLLVALVLVGAVLGGLAAGILDTSLVRSDAGTAPVPAAVVAWPWRAELALVSVLVVGCATVSVIAASAQVRRSDTARLGETES